MAVLCPRYACGDWFRRVYRKQSVHVCMHILWVFGYLSGVVTVHVLPSREARVEIPRALRRFRAEGAAAEPVVFGSHRRPEAVVIPFELYSALLPVIEELEIAEIVRERRGERARPLGEFAVELGFDAGDYE